VIRRRCDVVDTCWRF